MEKNLYNVDITYVSEVTRDGVKWKKSGALWIVIPKTSLSAALTKARKFLRQNSDRYPEAVITGINHSGTIDELEGEAA